MFSLKEYLDDPCGTASIPYWKQKNIMIPEHLKIVHDRDYGQDLYADYVDEPYFRLRHDMKQIRPAAMPGVEVIAGSPDTGAFVELINASYDDLSVTLEQMESYRRTPVYCPDLWLLLKERKTGRVIAGGIADYDQEAGELILEWIKVHPEYRGHGYGQLVVNSLLLSMQGVARFATVSGKVKNPTDPEKLYRRCGFTGQDIWHILTRKEAQGSGGA